MATYVYVQLLKEHKSDSSMDLMEKLDKCLANGTDNGCCILEW